MKSVLISIKPEWCELIEKGQKTIEVRKTKPKLETPFKCYIYQTKRTWIYDIWQGKIIGEFVCDEITRMAHCGYDNQRIELNIVDESLKCKKPDKGFLSRCCLSYSDIGTYANGGDAYGWHMSDLVIYDEPKELSEFYKGGMLSYDDWHYGIYNGNGGARSSYESYKNVFKLSKAPQSWCYVEEVMNERKD